MSNLFNQILFLPLFNFLIILYNSVAFHDLGLAVIILTVIIRIIIFPIFHRSLKHQRKLQKLGPHIKRIQEEHKDNKEKQAQAIMELYKEHGVNPFSQFYLLLIQFPILYALYRVVLTGVNSSNLRSLLYPWVVAPAVLTPYFLGVLNLNSRSLFIAVIAGVVQYLQAATSIPKPPKGTKLSPTEEAGRKALLFMVGFMFIFAYTLPAAIGLYLITTTLFTLAQQVIVNRQTEEDFGREQDGRGH